MEESIKLLNTLNINSTDYIIVGCSSGPDSMCLLNLLYENGYNVICAHVNHNIRPESKIEFDYLKNYCKEKSIIFEGLELEKKQNRNEYYYRKKRHTFYRTLADKYNTKFIATAHHGDDLIETILMRITRGSNLKGYLGFSKVFNEKGYIMIKPLIYYTKKEILDYLEKNNIKYFIDATNDSDNYTRNRYRHSIIPFLKKENENINRKYLQFSEELENANAFINKIVDDAIQNNYVDKSIVIDKFLVLDRYIMQRELERIFSELYGDDIDLLSKRVINKIIDQLGTKKNFEISLPKKYIVCREYDKLYFRKKEKKNEYNILLQNHNVIDSTHVIDIITETKDKSNNCIKLNSKDIVLPLYIRNRKNGDTIQIKNSTGHQKIKQIFIDKKISPAKRELYPIVVDSNDTILWIPGLKKSKFDNDINEKYDIILKYTRKE